MNFIIGAGGRLGGAIARAYGEQAVAVPRQVYGAWWREDAIDAIAEYFFERAAGAHCTLHVACGVVDPRASLDTLRKANFLLPRNVLLAAQKSRVKAVTFGTVMEKLVSPGSANAYVATKQELAAYIATLKPNAGVLHLRIHTLYGGGPPAPNMFLGQMLAAFQAGRVFGMSSGTQLREYHHVDDEAKAIRQLCMTGCEGQIDLSHGAPVTLRDLASYVFQRLGKPDLLAVGASPDPIADNFDTFYQRPALLTSAVFRPTLEGVADYMADATIARPLNL